MKRRHADCRSPLSGRVKGHQRMHHEIRPWALTDLRQLWVHGWDGVQGSWQYMRPLASLHEGTVLVSERDSIYSKPKMAGMARSMGRLGLGTPAREVR